jgi:hypothetical protein
MLEIRGRDVRYLVSETGERGVDTGCEGCGGEDGEVSGAEFYLFKGLAYYLGRGAFGKGNNWGMG